MPKTAVDKWIKNVYNLGKRCIKSRGQSSTESVHNYQTAKMPGYIHTIIPNFYTQITQTFTQLFYRKLPQLNSRFYTLYTGPITTKTKEK